MSSSRRLNPYEFIQGGCSSESPRPRFTLPRHPSEVTVGCHAQPLTRCSRADLLRQESLPRDVCAAQAPSRTLWMMLGSWSGRRDSIWGSGDAARRRPLHMSARLTCGPLEGRLHAFNSCRELSMKLARYQSRQAAIATEAPTEASPMPMGWRFRALCLLCAVRPGAVAPDYRRLFEKGSTGPDEGVGPACLATRMGVGDRGDRARGNLAWTSSGDLSAI